MSKTIPTQIRIDSDIKNDCANLFSKLGLDLSSAVNIFLRQCLIHNGLPFSVEVPKYSDETIRAMIEAKAISHDPNIPSYTNIEDLKKALLSD